MGLIFFPSDGQCEHFPNRPAEGHTLGWSGKNLLFKQPQKQIPGVSRRRPQGLPGSRGWGDPSAGPGISIPTPISVSSLSWRKGLRNKISLRDSPSALPRCSQWVFLPPVPVPGVSPKATVLVPGCDNLTKAEVLQRTVRGLS